MKGVTKQLSLDTIKIHAPDFDCGSVCGSASSTAAVQNIPPRPDVALQPDFESMQYKLPPPLPDRPPPECIPQFHLIIHQHAH